MFDVMLRLCDVAENDVPVGVQGLASVSGKRSATGVPTDENGMTFARTPGQVSSSRMRNAKYHCLPVQCVYLFPVPFGDLSGPCCTIAMLSKI